MTMKKMITVSAASVLTFVGAGQFVCSPVFANGPVDISIVEKVDDGSGGYKDWEDITDAMPGVTYSAIPRVKNDGSTAVEVRMCLSESAKSSDGGSISLRPNTFGIEINGNWELEKGSKNASDPAKGNCYRYNSKIAVGEVTEPLFSEVTLSPELGNEYQGATFNLHLDAYAAEEFPEETPSEETSGETAKERSEKAPDTGFLGTGVDGVVVGGIAAAAVVALLGVLVSRKERKHR